MISTKQNPDAAILRANASFYRAFSMADYGAMSELWAERAPVACLHPTSPALIGREAVLKSWKQIMLGRPPLELRCDRPVVHVVGEVAIVTCYEGGGDRPAHLAATNVFVLEGGKWRMVHHQAGPIATPIARPNGPSLLN